MTRGTESGQESARMSRRAVCTRGRLLVIALTPHEGHPAALYLLGAEVAGLLWYLLHLRSRIASQSAGVYRTEVVELERSAEASSPIR